MAENFKLQKHLKLNWSPWWCVPLRLTHAFVVFFSAGEVSAHKNSINAVASNDTCIFTGSRYPLIILGNICKQSPQSHFKSCHGNFMLNLPRPKYVAWMKLDISMNGFDDECLIWCSCMGYDYIMHVGCIREGIIAWHMNAFLCQAVVPSNAPTSMIWLRSFSGLTSCQKRISIPVQY